MRALASDSLFNNESEQGYVMAQHNADRVADWNGQSGERCIAHQARLDAVSRLEVVNDRLELARHLTNTVVFHGQPVTSTCSISM